MDTKPTTNEAVLIRNVLRIAYERGCDCVTGEDLDKIDEILNRRQNDVMSILHSQTKVILDAKEILSDLNNR